MGGTPAAVDIRHPQGWNLVKFVHFLLFSHNARILTVCFDFSPSLSAPARRLAASADMLQVLAESVDYVFVKQTNWKRFQRFNILVRFSKTEKILVA